MALSNNNMLFSSLRKLDVDIDGTLSRFVDNDELYIKFLRRYPDEDMMKLVYKAFEKNDREEIIRALHKLKGVSGNLGMKSIERLSESITALVRDNIESDVMPLLKELEEAYYRICAVIEDS